MDTLFAQEPETATPQDLNDLAQQLVTVEARKQDFETITEAKIEEAALFVGGCKAAEEWIEADRVAKVKPLNDEVRDINKAHHTVKEGFTQARQFVEAKVATWRSEQKRLADERQRLELERAAEEQRQRALALQQKQEALAKAEAAARLEAEQAKLEEAHIDVRLQKARHTLQQLEEGAPERLNPDYEQRLLRAQERVIDLEVEKNHLESVQVDTTHLAQQREELAVLEAEAAAPVIAAVVEVAPSTVKTAKGSVTFGEEKKDWVLPGWDRKKKFKTADLVLPQDLAKLPERIQFLLRASVLDVPQLNALYNAGTPLPKPFGETVTMGGSVVRKA